MTKFQKKKCLEAAEQKTSKLLVVVCCCKTVGIQILLGKQTDLEEKLMRLPKILPYLEGMTGILHLENWSRDNTDIVFKNVPQTEG